MATSPVEPIRDPEVLQGYLTDASNRHGHAEALVRPRSTDEVARVVAHCQAEGIPLTVTAARTSTTAGPVPDSGWLLSTEGLDAVGSFDETSETVVAGAGVILGQLQDALEARGRLFPPDPTSRHDCTLGAAIACNASGARSFRYGPTRPWIRALTVVLPTGEVRTFRRGDPIPEDWPVPAWTEPPVKTAAGYAPATDAVDLFIGSEGTLGVVTEAELVLTDAPEDVVGMLAFFDDVDTAIRFVEAARQAARTAPDGDLSPRCLEYLDAACLDLARERGAEVPEGAVAALFCEQEIHDPDRIDDHLTAWWTALEEGGALADDTLMATDAPSRARLHALRHAVPAGINEIVVRQGMPKLGTDLAVPDDGLRAMMAAYAEAPMRHVLFGHIGDNHLHLNLLPSDAAELAEAKAFYDHLARVAIRLGGTVSAEHGIGKVKAEQLSWMVDAETLEAFRRLKAALDPAWVLGRGTLFDPPDDPGLAKRIAAST